MPSGGLYTITAAGATGTGLGNYDITYNSGLLFVTAIAIPGTVVSVTDDGAGGSESGGSGSGDAIRTVPAAVISTSVAPCLSASARDTLSDQLTGIRDLIEISPELAASLPFYKIQTHAPNAFHVTCGASATSPGDSAP